MLDPIDEFVSTVLVILPPIVFPLTAVYSIISFPICRNPVLVVPTPTLSNVENWVASSTDNEPTESVVYSVVNLVGLISDWTPNTLTLLSGKYIPWFLAFTLTWSPSLAVIISSTWTSPPLVKFNAVDTPALLVKNTVFAAPTV